MASAILLAFGLSALLGTTPGSAAFYTGGALVTYVTIRLFIGWRRVATRRPTRRP